MVVSKYALRNIFSLDTAVFCSWDPISDYLRLVYEDLYAPKEDMFTRTVSWYMYNTDTVSVNVTGLTDRGNQTYH